MQDYSFFDLKCDEVKDELGNSIRSVVSNISSELVGGRINLFDGSVGEWDTHGYARNLAYAQFVNSSSFGLALPSGSGLGELCFLRRRRIL